jgi:restriction endonuclease S subunit
MVLRKEEWKEILYGDYVDHIEQTERDPELRKNAKYVSVDNIESNNLKIQSHAKEEMPTFFRKFKKNQVLFSKRNLYLNKVVVADFDGICSPHIWALETKNGLMQELLPFYMLTKKFFKYTNSNAAGTMSKYLGWEELSKFKLHLPPPDSQKDLVRLFHNLESIIEKLQDQKKLLKKIQKKIVNDLVSESPVFGNLLNKKNCNLNSLAEICDCDSEKSPTNYTPEKFIGLENIEPGNFKIQGSGDVSNGTTFTKYFTVGDVLFAKRRPYLRKVAVADFDGFCSSDILTFRPKKNMMLPELFPFYISAETFILHAVATSAGSLSPRTKWKDLAVVKFSVPNLEVQEKISLVLNNILSIAELIGHQKNLIDRIKYKVLNEVLG